MNRGLTIFLQGVTVILGVFMFVFLLWEPHLEGRNVDATLFEIYFRDPFLVYVYVASLSFFMALYQVFRALGYMRANKVFSLATVKALRMIRYSALSLAAFAIGVEGYLFVVRRGEDDIAGGAVLIFFVMVISVATAFMAIKF